MGSLTPTDRKALEFLLEMVEREEAGKDGVDYSTGDVRPGQLARHLWPDSPAWKRRTHKGGAGGPGGAMGGTMPMLGAKVLWKLVRGGLVSRGAYDRYSFRITQSGREALRG